MIGNRARDATVFFYVLKVCGIAIAVFYCPVRAVLDHLIKLSRSQLDLAFFPYASRNCME